MMVVSCDYHDSVVSGWLLAGWLLFIMMIIILIIIIFVFIIIIGDLVMVAGGARPPDATSLNP